MRYKDLQLGQLRAFRACVRQQSFSAAARALAMSQPAVWQQVRALERHFGVALLQRRGKGIEPTDDGRLLLEMSASILGEVDSLREAFTRRREDLPRRVTLIGSPGVLAEDLARPLVAFRQAHPTIRLTLLNITGEGTLDLLVSGTADLAVIPASSTLVRHRQLLTTEPLGVRPWMLLAPRRHPLARQRQPSLRAIVRQPLILPEEDSAWRQRLDALFLAAGVLEQMQVALEVSSSLAARRFVSLGVGVALLPLPNDGIAFADLSARPLGDLLPPEEIALLWRRGGQPSPQARLLADFLKQQLDAPASRKRSR